jgi:hypothetical protein
MNSSSQTTKFLERGMDMAVPNIEIATKLTAKSRDKVISATIKELEYLNMSETDNVFMGLRQRNGTNINDSYIPVGGRLFLDGKYVVDIDIAPLSWVRALRKVKGIKLVPTYGSTASGKLIYNVEGKRSENLNMFPVENRKTGAKRIATNLELCIVGGKKIPVREAITTEETIYAFECFRGIKSFDPIYFRSLKNKTNVNYIDPAEDGTSPEDLERDWTDSRVVDYPASTHSRELDYPVIDTRIVNKPKPSQLVIPFKEESRVVDYPAKCSMVDQVQYLPKIDSKVAELLAVVKGSTVEDKLDTIIDLLSSLKYSSGDIVIPADLTGGEEVEDKWDGALNLLNGKFIQMYINKVYDYINIPKYRYNKEKALRQAVADMKEESDYKVLADQFIRRNPRLNGKFDYENAKTYSNKHFFRVSGVEFRRRNEQDKINDDLGRLRGEGS